MNGGPSRSLLAKLIGLGYYLVFLTEARPQEFHFQPQQVIDEAHQAAVSTRAMADLIDTRGQDFLSLLDDFTSSEGNGLDPRQAPSEVGSSIVTEH